MARVVEAQGGGVALSWRALAIVLALTLAALAALHWGCLALISKDDLGPWSFAGPWPPANRVLLETTLVGVLHAQ